MKIQFLNGGLANQAFQYIFARYFSLSHPDEIMYLDDSWFALHTVHNGYELKKVFGIHAPMLSECFDKSIWRSILAEKKKGKSIPQIFDENQITIQMIAETDSYHSFNPYEGCISSIPSNGYYPEIMEVPGNVYYHGYWINKCWFERYSDIFLQEFTFPEIVDEKNLQYLEQIQSSKSLCVHVRRGDYVTLGWELDPTTYRSGLKAFAEQVSGSWHLFVFSDDICWCRKHASELGFNYFSKHTFIEGNLQGKNYLDLQLMTRCQAMIVSNSAFSYLAALLNPGKQYMLNLSSRLL